MNGLTEDEVMDIRNKALAELQEFYPEESIELIDNYHHENVPEGAGRLWHLGTSIRMMEDADGVYFCGGWEKAKGCGIEFEVCRLYRLRILNKEFEWFNRVK
jgi:hypothetical protein